MNAPLESQPFLSSSDIVSDARSAFTLLEQQSFDLYQRLQALPKENLSLEKLQKVIGLMLEIKKQLPMDDVLQIAGEKAKKTPELLDAEDRAAEIFRNDIESGMQDGKTFLSSLDSWFVNGKNILFAPLKALFTLVKTHPQIVLAIITAIVTRNGVFSATGFINSIFAGASENSFLIKMIAWILKIPSQDILLIMKEGVIAYMAKKGKDMILGGSSHAGEAIASFPSKSSPSVATPRRGDPLSFATALRVLGSRTLGAFSFLVPKEMGDGMLTPGQMKENQRK